MLSYPNSIPQSNMLINLIFYGRLGGVSNLSTLLDLFVDFSGLKINYTKAAFLGLGLMQAEGIQCLAASGTSILEVYRCGTWAYHCRGGGG